MKDRNEKTFDPREEYTAPKMVEYGDILLLTRGTS